MSKVRTSHLKLSGVPKQTGRSICPRGWARCPGTTPWNGEVSFLSKDLLILMSARVSA